MSCRTLICPPNTGCSVLGGHIILVRQLIFLLDSGSYSDWPDFTVTIDGKKVYLEHMGKLEDPQYHRKQVEKIKNYRIHASRLGENLIITSSHRHFQAPRILSIDPTSP